MIYKREQPNTPAKRFRSALRNPVGINISNKSFYKHSSKVVGKKFGYYVCDRRKTTNFKTKFNIRYGMYQCTPAFIAQISLARRYKTFVGLVKYSNGAVSCIPLFNGAYPSMALRTYIYQQTPKIRSISRYTAGTTAPVAYLPITACFYNIMSSFNRFAWFCHAGGTFCTIVRYNAERGSCTIRLPSNKHRLLHEHTYVMLGRNANTLINKIRVGKAGVNVLRGFRPSVRGVAMNPVDHPHGGRTKSNSPERTPWGRIAKHNK